MSNASSTGRDPAVDSASPRPERRRPRLLYVVFVCVLIAAAVAWIPKALDRAGLWPEFTPRLLVIADDQSQLMSHVAADAPAYAAEHGVVLEYELIDIESTFDRARKDFRSGAKKYDAVCVLKSTLLHYARPGLVLRPDALRKHVRDPELLAFEDDVYPNVWEACASYWAPDGSGKIERAGYPFAVNATLLMYNRRLFDDPRAKAEYRDRHGEELEVPRDWERFRRVAEFFTPADESSKGLCLSNDPVWRYIEWCSIVFGMGGAIYDKQHGWQGEPQTPLLLESPATVAATEYYLGLKPFDFDHGRPERDVAAVQALVETMQRERIAMCFIRTDFLHQFLYAGGSGEAGARFGFAPVPGDVTTVDARVIYVSRDTPTPAATARYVASLMQKETQVRLMEKGLCSALASAYDDPRAAKIPFTAALRQAYAPPRRIVLLECTPEVEIAIQALAANLERAWNGEATAPESLASARQEIESQRAAAWKEFEAGNSSNQTN